MGPKKKGKKRAPNDKTSFEILIALSKQFAGQGCYLQSTQCLEAICNMNDLIPAQRSQACVQLACTLLDHFDSMDHAKNRLLQAVRLLM